MTRQLKISYDKCYKNIKKNNKKKNRFKCIFFLKSSFYKKKMIYITRHGESEYNVSGRIGGDSSLTLSGQLYAKRLRAFFNEEPVVICSNLKRTRETSGEFTQVTVDKNLNEINAGICEHMTYQEIGQAYPDVSREREADKFHYQYPRGESYSAVYVRVKQLIEQLKTRQTEPTLIVCHQAVARMLLSILLERDPVDFVTMDIPLHQLIRIDTATHQLDFVAP